MLARGERYGIPKLESTGTCATPAGPTFSCSTFPKLQKLGVSDAMNTVNNVEVKVNDVPFVIYARNFFSGFAKCAFFYFLFLARA